MDRANGSRQSQVAGKHDIWAWRHCFHQTLDICRWILTRLRFAQHDFLHTQQNLYIVRYSDIVYNLVYIQTIQSIYHVISRSIHSLIFTDVSQGVDPVSPPAAAPCLEKMITSQIREDRSLALCSAISPPAAEAWSSIGLTPEESNESLDPVKICQSKRNQCHCLNSTYKYKMGHEEINTRKHQLSIAEPIRPFLSNPIIFHYANWLICIPCFPQYRREQLHTINQVVQPHVTTLIFHQGFLSLLTCAMGRTWNSGAMVIPQS